MNNCIKKLFYILGMMLFFSSCHLYQNIYQITLNARLSVELLNEGNLSNIKKLVDKGADINLLINMEIRCY